MSEATTLTSGQSATIYGSFAAASDYAATMFGPTYAAWRALQPDDQKRTLIAASRFFDAQGWDPATAGTMADRDAIAAFPQASYELAVMIADDPTVLQTQDQGTNVRAVGAGSARVEFFNPTSAASGTAPLLPPPIMRLVGRYLALSVISMGGAPESQAAGCSSPFASTAEYLRWWPY
jgi:hypothetical protein